MASDTEEKPQFTAREVAEAVLKAGFSPQEVMRALERGSGRDVGGLAIESPDDAAVVSLRADAEWGGGDFI